MDINHYRTLVLAIFDAYLENPEKQQNEGRSKVSEGKSAFEKFCTKQGDSLTLGQIKDHLTSTKGNYVNGTLQTTGLSMVTSGRGTFLRLHLEPLIEYLEHVLAQLTQSQQSTARANAILAQLAQNYGWNTQRQNSFLGQFKYPTPLTTQELQALLLKEGELTSQLSLAEQQLEAEKATKSELIAKQAHDNQEATRILEQYHAAQRKIQRLQQILEPQANQIAGLLCTETKQAEQLQALTARLAQMQAKIDQLTHDNTELARQNSLLQETERQATEQATKLLQKCSNQDGRIAVLTEQLKKDKVVMQRQEREAANHKHLMELHAQKHEALAADITRLRGEVSRLTGEHRVDIPAPTASVFSFWQTMSDPDSPDTASRRHFPGKL